MRWLTSGAGGLSPRVSLAMAGSLALFACGTGAGAALPVSPAPISPSPSPAVSSSPSAPAASAAANRANVSGRMDGGVYQEDEATSRLYFKFTYTMSDPRVTGTEEIDCTERFFDLKELGSGAGVGVWWDCSMTLVGQGGTWKGVTGYGSEYMKDGHLRTNGVNIYEGQGAFAGMRYVTMFTSGPETNAFGEGYVIAGWIEPAE